MIDPPSVTNGKAKLDYLGAVQKVTGVWQLEVSIEGNLDRVNRHIAKMWPLTFSSDQQQAIIVEFTARRLAR